MDNKCCKGCKKRHYNCWSDCEDYLKFKKECDKIKDNMKKHRSWLKY